MKLLGSFKSKITKDENGENFPHLEITEVLLKIVILVTTIISKIQESYIHLFLTTDFVNYYIFHHKNLFF